ncbi:hypothetical protein HY640_03210 [Candidatus Woesearchaeota archaeon]|nr:hypothetical protein [Candidatus Woesearchaeota archaeon]
MHTYIKRGHGLHIEGRLDLGYRSLLGLVVAGGSSREFAASVNSALAAQDRIGVKQVASGINRAVVDWFMADSHRGRLYCQSLLLSPDESERISAASVLYGIMAGSHDSERMVIRDALFSRLGVEKSSVVRARLLSYLGLPSDSYVEASREEDVSGKLESGFPSLFGLLVTYESGLEFMASVNNSVALYGGVKVDGSRSRLNKAILDFFMADPVRGKAYCEHRLGSSDVRDRVHAASLIYGMMIDTHGEERSSLQGLLRGRLDSESHPEVYERMLDYLGIPASLHEARIHELRRGLAQRI